MDMLFLRPSTQEEALALLTQYKQDAMIVAGGTDAVLRLTQKKTAPAVILSLDAIPERHEIAASDDTVRLASGVTYNELLASDVLRLYRGLREAVLHLARLTAEVTHNHPEGIKGAQATAAAIYLARTGHSKADIKAYVEREFSYDLSRTCDKIRPTYHHVESCQETVPQAITAFLESTDFEDALRTAVSLGGDSDTLAAITGSIAEGFYGVPEDLKQECRQRLTPELTEILLAFQNND